MSDDRVVDAIENTTNEVIIFQAESHLDAIRRARKRRKAREESEVEAEAETREVDESDSIAITGHSKSLMYLVRKFGLECCNKNFKDANSIEKYYAKLSLNSIVDLQDKKYMALLNISSKATESLKSQFEVAQLVIPDPNNVLVKVYSSIDNMTDQQKYKFLTIESFDLTGDNQKKISIMSEIYKVLSRKNNFLEKWNRSSEWTLIIKLWSRIFETLFEDTVVDLVWGDTKNETFKVDLRLCLEFDKKMYDISNIEFKKNGNEPGQVKKDGAKVLNEGKSILNRLIEEYNLDFEEAKEKKIFVAQICGLKAVFSQLRLAAPGCYMPSHFGRTLKYPYNGQRAKGFCREGLEQLFCYKNEVVKEANMLKNALVKDSSEFGSQSTIVDKHFLKQCYTIPATATKWPKVHDDFYKS
ncbi:hypothetical protein BD560DRAFT_119291 [Blakeslea trispora]|nr:hypothetical protein BD560DRAFT_119291 [Blakeslea trispora]